MPASEVHLRRIAECRMRLDLKTAHTITEDFTLEERLRNVEPHFQKLWGPRAPITLIMDWIESNELYQSPEFANLPDLQEYLGSLTAEQLLPLVGRVESSLFHVRMVEGRIRKFQEQRTINGLAARDVKRCFDMNLGLLIGERATDETDYLVRLTQKQFMARVRLARATDDARLLRDLITTAFRLDVLDNDLLSNRRLRLSALQEHFDEAQELLGEAATGGGLLDHSCQDWL